MNATTASVVLALLLAGCVSPTVVVVDQKTALEQQAAGDYPPLDNELEQAGLAPSPSRARSSPPGVLGAATVCSVSSASCTRAPRRTPT
jgi:hypothetical protein